MRLHQHIYNTIFQKRLHHHLASGFFITWAPETADSVSKFSRKVLQSFFLFLAPAQVEFRFLSGSQAPPPLPPLLLHLSHFLFVRFRFLARMCSWFCSIFLLLHKAFGLAIVAVRMKSELLKLLADIWLFMACGFYDNATILHAL